MGSRSLPLLALAASIAVLLGLALPRPASALISQTNITSPASPYQVFWDFDNPVLAPTVSGTANGPTAVDINCYYGANADYGTLPTAHLATNVPVNSGTFSTSLSFTNAFSNPCVMRAVPHGDTTAYPPDQSSSYTGPTMLFGYTSRTFDGQRIKNFFAYPTGALGDLDIASPDQGALYDSSVVNPADLTQSHNFFGSAGAL